MIPKPFDATDGERVLGLGLESRGNWVLLGPMGRLRGWMLLGGLGLGLGDGASGSFPPTYISSSRTGFDAKDRN